MLGTLVQGGFSRDDLWARVKGGEILRYSLLEDEMHDSHKNGSTFALQVSVGNRTQD